MTNPSDPLARIQSHLSPAWTIFTTPAVRDSYVHGYKKLAKNSIIFPGVDVDNVTKGVDPARARRTLRIPEDVPLITMFARLTRVKGQHILVEASAQVLRAHATAHFVIAGGTIAGIEPAFPGELRAQIKQLDVEGRVSLTGFLDDQDKRDLLAASDVVAYPAAFEPFGLSVVEGMAAGKPVVAAAAEGPVLTMQHERTGLLVPIGDAEALAVALKRLIENPTERQRLGNAGKIRAQQFSSSTMVRKIIDVYDTLLESRLLF